MGERIEAVGLDEGTANNDLSGLIRAGQNIEQALAALYGDHGPNEAPDPSRVKRAGQPGAVEAVGMPPRGRDGYDTPVTLDAASLKALVEKTRGAPLVDKPEKLEAWRNGTAKTDPAKFPIELAITPDGRLDVNDGLVV